MTDVGCCTEGPDPDSVFTFCVKDILDYNNANKCQDLHDYWTYSNNTRVHRTSLVFKFIGSADFKLFQKRYFDWIFWGGRESQSFVLMS